MLNDLLYGLKYLYAKTSKGHAADEAQIEDFVFDLLDQSQGLAFGEYHGAYACPRFLKARMKQFADHGVKALFVEFIPRGKQTLLDEWQNASNPKPLVDFMNARKKANSTYQWQNYWEMIEAAREAGIRVYGTNIVPENHLDKWSMKKANEIWLNVVKRVVAHFNPDDKYLLFGGRGHFQYTCNGEKGVSYQLGIPSVQLDFGRHLLVKQAISPQEHLVRIPLGDDHISVFRGPVVRHQPISYPE